jgi:hypothetical protein
MAAVDEAQSLTIMLNLPIVYIGQLNYEKAVETAEICYNISLKLFGVDHVNTLKSMHWLGFSNGISCNRFNRSKHDFLTECMERRTKLLGAGHEDTKQTAKAIQTVKQHVRNYTIFETSIYVGLAAIAAAGIYHLFFERK